MAIDLQAYQAGHFEKAIGYKYFVPSLINDEWLLSDPELIELLAEAANNVGVLTAYTKLVPEADLFMVLHITKEAVDSSKIEGTKTDIDEALYPEEEIAPERKEDWKEVANYITAMNTAIVDLKSLPVSTRLLRKTHRILLRSVRGESKRPG